MADSSYLFNSKVVPWTDITTDTRNSQLVHLVVQIYRSAGAQVGGPNGGPNGWSNWPMTGGPNVGPTGGPIDGPKVKNMTL